MSNPVFEAYLLTARIAGESAIDHCARDLVSWHHRAVKVFPMIGQTTQEKNAGGIQAVAELKREWRK